MRFFGPVGYADPTETPPGSGVWKDIITEVSYYGDIIRNVKQSDQGDKINDDIRVSNSISIVADDYAIKHFFKIRYVQWEGGYWTVTDVEVKPPRLVLTLGSVYNGPKA